MGSEAIAIDSEAIQRGYNREGVTVLFLATKQL